MSTLILFLCTTMYCLFFFFNDTATTEIYTLSLHDALPILPVSSRCRRFPGCTRVSCRTRPGGGSASRPRSEEHTSELQSPCNLVCRLLLEKKKKQMRALTQRRLEEQMADAAARHPISVCYH